MQPRENWSILEERDVLHRLHVDAATGLTTDEVAKRRKTYGANVLTRERSWGLLGRIFKQFKNPLVLVLLIAGVATIFLGKNVDTVVIFIALFINLGIGTFQEERAGKAFEKLAASQKKFATVMRGGTRQVVSAEDVVPGDIVELSAGMSIPADIYLLEAHDLSMNESALTGEWEPSGKQVGALDEVVTLADQTNMGWMGTLVLGGRGKGVVVATGGQTEFGVIAASLGEESTVRTPIQKNIASLARFLTLIILAVVGLVFVLGVVRGELVSDMLLLAIAVAVSVVPEGLPAVVTVILAIGMERLLARGGLVRNLLAVETLGSTTLILTDKTGTLTEARMGLQDIVTLDPTGAEVALNASLHASDALDGLGTSAEHPIERAIAEGAVARGVDLHMVEQGEPRIDFLPFSSERRFAAALCTTEGGARLYVSGAPEFLLSHAEFAYIHGNAVALTKEHRDVFQARLTQAAKEGMRVIGVSYKETSESQINHEAGQEEKLLLGSVFVGLLVFSDPVRIEVPDAIKQARAAGAKVVMLTGDNPETARAIGKHIHIAGDQEPRVLVGSDLDGLSDDELFNTIQNSDVLARVLPDQKLRIANVLRDRDEVVAMTGDGINDAPALRAADIGIAVGAGTEVAKEASDLVLINNSFAIIVAAIEEGRRIIDNLKKAITHLVATSFGEVFVVAGALVVGLPLPILPVQILWLNIIEEGLLNFAFAFEPGEPDLMQRDPRGNRVRAILTPKVRSLILATGALTGILVLVLYIVMSVRGMDLGELRTIVFVALSLDAIFFALSLKNLYRPIWRSNLFSNRFLIFSLGVSVALLLGTLLIPPLRDFLSLEPLSRLGVYILIGVAIFDLAAIEIAKAFLFRKYWKAR